MQTAYFPYFLELAKTLSFSQAARTLNVSQSGLSRAISNIEREVGCPLFLRRGNSIYITKEGERFAEYAKEAVAILEKIHQLPNPTETDYLHDRFDTRQMYCDATSTSFAVLTAMNRRNSTKLQGLHYSELSPDLILKKLELQKPEDPWLFFVSVPAKGRFARKIERTKNLSFESLLEIRAMAKVSNKSSFAKKGMLTPEDLSQASWAVSSDFNINDILIAATGSKHTEKHVSFRSVRRGQVDRMILESDCVGLTNDYSKGALSPRFVAIPFQRDVVSLVGLLVRSDFEPSQEMVDFRRKITVACNKLKQLPW